MSAAQFTQFKSATPNPNVPKVMDASPEEVNEKKSQVAIIDVRRPDEWIGEYGHIAEAEHIVLDTLPMRIGDLPTDKTIIFVCRSGARSAQATAFALENGYSSVYNMRGGMIEWTKKNFAAVDKNN